MIQVDKASLEYSQESGLTVADALRILWNGLIRLWVITPYQ
jgi:hypothetical protein